MRLVFISYGFLLIFINCGIYRIDSLKTFTYGYNGKNLPPGGWTRWFNADHPNGLGDYETLSNVVREYGDGCQGVPCRHPIGVKVLSTRHYSPKEEGDRVYVSPRRGLTCANHHQRDGKCADYQIRFYCPGMHKLCRKGHKPITKQPIIIEKLTTSTTMKPEKDLKNKVDIVDKNQNAIDIEPQREFNKNVINSLNPKSHKKIKIKKELYKKEVAAQTDHILLSGKNNGFFSEDTGALPSVVKKEKKLKRHFLHQ